MLPTTFLSFSGKDEKFVENVRRHLPAGLAYFYPESFSNGENLISAMEKRVGQSTVFALFASNASLESVWVQFEIYRARISKIVRPDFKVLIFPIEAGIDFAKIPDWIKEYWIGGAGVSPRDIARYIRGTIISLPTPLNVEPFGRGALFDLARSKIQTTVRETGETPNVFVFGGNAGIGRRTFQKMLFDKALPGLPHLNFGPEFALPQFADLVDIYRFLREEIEPNFSISRFSNDRLAFETLSVPEQIEEVVKSLGHFGTLGQAITVITGNGIYEDKGVLKHWVPPLFQRLSDEKTIKLSIISNRLLHDRELRPHNNVMQLPVNSINDEEIKTLISTFVPIFGAKAALPSDDVIRAIGGHPSIARAVSRLIAERGTTVVNNDFSELYSVQEEVLAESLDFPNLSDNEREVLSILSWVPQLSGEMLTLVLKSRSQLSNQDLADLLGGLMLACLVQLSGENYSISPPIRTIFRKKYGYGSTELMAAFSAVLKSEWEKSEADDEFKTVLLDAIVFMHALEGGTLPKEFQGLLLASTLQGVVKETYDRWYSDEGALRRTIVWGLPAKNMKMDEAVREEILSYVVRAQVRLSQFPDAKILIKFMDDRKYRSVAYLTAFYIRYSGGPLEEALSKLIEAKAIKKYMKAVMSDMAICLKRLGKWKELEDLLVDQKDYIDNNATLLDLYIGNLISKGRFPEAEDKIAILRAMPNDRGMADARLAGLLMRRDRDFSAAEKLLTTVLNTSGKGFLGVRRLRASAAARAGNYGLARLDVQHQLGKPGGQDTAHRIEAEIKLHQHDYAGAHQEHDKIKNPTAQDKLLEARIIEAEANDVSTPLAERSKLSQIAVGIRVNNRSVDEFDYDRD